MIKQEAEGTKQASMVSFLKDLSNICSLAGLACALRENLKGVQRFKATSVVDLIPLLRLVMPLIALL